MLLLYFKTQLSPDEINARFEHWRDHEDHAQWKIFLTFTNPRSGLELRDQYVVKKNLLQLIPPVQKHHT